MASNGNNWVVKVLITMLWGVIITALTGTIWAMVDNDKDSRSRDDEIEIRLTTKIELGQRRIEESQKETNDTLGNFKDEMQQQTTEILVTLAEIKKDVKKIQ